MYLCTANRPAMVCIRSMVQWIPPVHTGTCTRCTSPRVATCRAHSSEMVDDIFVYTYKTHIKQIEVLQRKAIRAITKCNYNATTSPLFKKTKILKFSDIYNTQISTFMYDYSTSNLPIPLAQIFGNSLS